MKLLRLFFLTLAIILFAQTSLAETDVAEAIQFPVEKFQLKNGLTVLVHEDHTLPIITYQQWFRVGSRDEKPGRTGLAHFFEHLMFKGTEKFPGKDFDRMIQANGGVNNAFTTRDYTGYYINLPSSKLELAIDIESDRMRNLLFDPKEVQSEREVVKEERRYRVENSVYGILDEAIFKTVFKVHPYRWPVIGYMADLNAATIDDMKEFYRVYYAPNNAVVVIAGDVNTSEVKALMEKYYAGIPAQELPKKEFPKEPDQTAQRNVNLTKDLQSPVFALAYKIMKAGEDSAYAMDLLASVLASGPSSRLYRRLVYKEQLATEVSAWSYTPSNEGVFEVVTTMKSGADMEKAVSSVFAELYKLRKTPVTEEELQMAKNQVIFSYVNGLKTTAGKASALALNEIMFGDYKVLFEDLKKYIQVTPADIQKAAEEYLQPHQRSVIRVRPAAAQGVGA